MQESNYHKQCNERERIWEQRKPFTNEFCLRTIPNKNMYDIFHFSAFCFFWEFKTIKWNMLRRRTKQTKSAFHETMPRHFLIKNVDHLFFLWSYPNNYENWQCGRTDKAIGILSLELGLDPKWIISSKKMYHARHFVSKLFRPIWKGIPFYFIIHGWLYVVNRAKTL